MRVDRLLPLVGIVPLAAFAACGGGSSLPPAPDPQPSAAAGDIRVTTTSTGEDQDLNAYLLKVGDSVSLIEWNDTVTYSNLPAEDWTVELQDVAENCSVADGATRNVSVADNSTTQVAFEVSCDSLPAAAVDVSGTWTGNFTGGPPNAPPETGSLVWVLEQHGDDVTGSVKTSHGGPVYTYDIEGGRVSGSTVTLFFLGKAVLGEEGYRFTSIGEVAAQRISGSVDEQMNLWLGTFTVAR